MDPNQIAQNKTSAEPLTEPSAESVLRDIAELRAELSASDKAPKVVSSPPPKMESSRAPEVVPLPPPQSEPKLPKQPEITPLPPKVTLPKPPEDLPQSTTIPLPERLLTPPPPAHHQKTPWGAIIGIVIIIIILIVGALYFWGAKLAREDVEELLPETSADTSILPEELPEAALPAETADETEILEDMPSEETASADITDEAVTQSTTIPLPEMSDDGFIPETDTGVAQ